MLSSTDFNQDTTSYGYGPTGLLSHEVQPVSATQSITTSFGYDAAGNKTRYTDGNGNNWSYTYNSWGLPESQVEPSTSAYTSAADSTFTVAYNEDGQPVTQTEPGGVSITDSYNNMGELTGQSGTGADAATATRTFGYDSAGNLTSASTSNTATTGSNATSETYTYNSRGEVLSAAGSGGTTSYGYNGDGLVTSVADAAGTTGYGYDTADRLQTLTDPATGTTATYAYNTDSQVASISYGSDTRAFGYNSLHQLTSDTLKTSAGATVASAGYGYNGNGQITSMNTTGLAGAASNTYTYDEAGRLTSWNNGAATTSYGYDNNGNLTTDGSKTYSYDARDQLTSDGTSTYSYTANGTLASQASPSGTVTSAFDAYGEQASTGSQAYSYDALGRVVSDTNTATGGKYTFSYSGATGTLASDGISTYTWDPSGTALAGIGVAGGTASQGVLALTNQHGDVTGQFTSAAATVSGSTGYDPWGNVTGSSGAVSGQLGYQSGWTEPATGKVSMGARWYSPGTGGFTSRDAAAVSPVPDPAAADPFAYAGDDPLNQADPSGHNACPDGLCSARLWAQEGPPCGTECQRQQAIEQQQFWQQEERQAQQQASSAGSCPWWDVVCHAVHLYHAAVNLMHRAENYAVQAEKLVAALSLRLAREGVRALDTAVKDAAKFGAHAAGAAWRRAVSAGARIYHAEVALTKAELHAVGTAWHGVARAATATVSFVKHHAAAITSIVVNVAVMAGCEATLGTVTAGAATMACSAIAGAASNAAAYAVTAAQTGHFSWAALGKTSLEGAAMGLAMGGLGALGGAAKALLGSGVDEAGSALADSAVNEAGDAATEGAANAAGETTGEAAGATSAGGDGAGAGGEGAGGGGRPSEETGSGDSSGDSCPTVGGKSFTAGTKVLLASGKIEAISKLRPGQKVLATDTRTGKNHVETVTAVMVHHDTDLYDLKVRAGNLTAVIDTTSSHLFWVPGTGGHAGRWVKAGALRYGTHLRTPGGAGAVALGGWVPRQHDGWMWDLTIQNDHDFYVDTPAAPVLVHNCSKPQGVYSFPDQWNPGKTYVGKTMNFGQRLGKHLDSGRLSSIEDADCLHVCGTEDDVFAAEHERITELRGQGVPLSNIIASPGQAIYNARKYVQIPLW